MKLVKATDGKHKYTVMFDDGKKVSFGAIGYGDYPTYVRNKPDEAAEHKQRYLARHRSRENWKDLRSPGALSRYILWDKPTIQESWNMYKARVQLKL